MKFLFYFVFGCLPASARAQARLQIDFDGRIAAPLTHNIRKIAGTKAAPLPDAEWIERLVPGSHDFQIFQEPEPFTVRTIIPPPIVVSAPNAAIIDPIKFYDTLASKDIIYAGEKHNLPAHHQIQLEILKELHARRPGMVVGLEMLDVTQQDSLDDYLSGRISDVEFKALWGKTWGFSFELYRSILEYARSEHIPVKALNAPISVIIQIVQGGLDSLTPRQRALLPETIHPIQDLRYLDYVKQSLEDHGPLTPDQKERMLQAMTVWNETMGESVIKALAQGGPVLVLAGMGHMLYRAGIMESVRDRVSLPQSVVLPYPMDGQELALDQILSELRKPDSPDITLADYFRLLPNP